MADTEQFLAEIDISVELLVSLCTPGGIISAIGETLQCTEGLPEGVRLVGIYRDPMSPETVSLTWEHPSFRDRETTTGRIISKLNVVYERKVSEISNWLELLKVAEMASVMLGTPANTAQTVFNLALWSTLGLNARMQGDVEERAKCLNDLYGVVADMLCAVRYLEIEKRVAEEACEHNGTEESGLHQRL